MYFVSEKTNILTLKRERTLKGFFFIFLDLVILSQKQSKPLIGISFNRVCPVQRIKAQFHFTTQA